MIKQVFYGLFSNFMIKNCQSTKNFYSTMSAIAAAGFQRQNLISKKYSKLGETAILSWSVLL